MKIRIIKYLLHKFFPFILFAISVLTCFLLPFLTFVLFSSRLPLFIFTSTIYDSIFQQCNLPSRFTSCSTIISFLIRTGSMEKIPWRRLTMRIDDDNGLSFIHDVSHTFTRTLSTYIYDSIHSHSTLSLHALNI